MPPPHLRKVWFLPGIPEDEETDFRSATQPPLLDNSAEAYEEQCQEAKALMAQAGYDSGANLGQLEYLYVDEGVHAAVAEALCQMWHETLGLEITPRGVTEQELWTALRSGRLYHSRDTRGRSRQ